MAGAPSVRRCRTRSFRRRGRCGARRPPRPGPRRRGGPDRRPAPRGAEPLRPGRATPARSAGAHDRRHGSNGATPRPAAVVVTPRHSQSRFNARCPAGARARLGGLRQPSTTCPRSRIGAAPGPPRQNGSMSTDSPTSSHPDTFGARTEPRVGGPQLRDLQHQRAGTDRALRRRPAALLHQGAPREPAAPRGRPPRLGRRHRGRGGLGRQPRGRTARARATAPTRSPSPPSASSCRTSPGVPAVVDLAAMRDALAVSGATPHRSTPSSPSSWSSTTRSSSSGPGDAVGLRHQRGDRVRAQHRALPAPALGPGRLRGTSGWSRPGTGICHQVNLEYLSRLVFATEDGRAFCDTLVGTDSHTTMVNGLGVLGLGRGRHRGRGGHAGPAPLHAAAARGRACASPARPSPGSRPPTSCSRSPSSCATTVWWARSSSATARAWPRSRSRPGPPSAT